MKIHRTKFMTLALSMSLGQAAGCLIQPQPAQPGYPQQVGNTANPNERGAPGAAPADECMEWDASGQCVGWAGGNAIAAPADECVQWNPSGECIGWAGDSAAPADECVQWNPSGECIGWAGDSAAPADECVQWNPSGECVAWE